MKMSWVPAPMDEWSFPRVNSFLARESFGDAVYQSQVVRQNDVDFLKKKGFELVAKHSEMGRGKIFLDTQHACEALVGTIYAYKCDIEEKLGAKPAPSPGRTIVSHGKPSHMVSG